MVKDSQSTTKGLVGIVSTSGIGLQEIAGLLAGEGVGVSQAIHVEEQKLTPNAAESAILTGLRACQSDPATEIIVLVSKMLSPDTAERVLAGVSESEKPTVVCLLGIDQRLLWRAGAIPAARLDEAALRAVAWVRGWDQALISSKLEDLDEQIVTQATKLRARLDPNRHQLRGFFDSVFFYQEAQMILSEILGEGAQLARLELWAKESVQTKLSSLKSALDDPEAAVILLGVDAFLDPGGNWVHALKQNRTGPVVIAYASGSTDCEKALHDAGIVLVVSNAAAARLSGMIVTPLKESNKATRE